MVSPTIYIYLKGFNHPVDGAEFRIHQPYFHRYHINLFFSSFPFPIVLLPNSHQGKFNDPKMEVRQYNFQMICSGDVPEIAIDQLTINGHGQEQFLLVLPEAIPFLRIWTSDAFVYVNKDAYIYIYIYIYI